MAHFIMFAISFIVFGLLLTSTHTQKLIRPSYRRNWRDYDWEPVSKERVKYPIWVWLIALVLSIIPIVNIIATVVVLITYIINIIRPSGSDGWEYEYTRIVIKTKFTDWIARIMYKKL